MQIRYLFFFILVPLIIFFGEYLIYMVFGHLGFFKNTYVRNIFITIGIIFPIMFLGVMVFGAKHFSTINSWIYTTGGVWLGLLAYLFITALIISLLILINTYLNLNIPLQTITILLIVCSIVTTVIGICNSSHPRLTKFEVKSPILAPLWKDKKIMFFSDVHLGETRQEKFMQKVVDIINKENPDIVFNLGDLIDGPSIPYAKVFAPLYKLNPPLGNYYVEGNHEGYSSEYALFKENIPTNINNVTDKKVYINGTQIIGMSYDMNKSNELLRKELELLKYNKTEPSIILLHDPKGIPFLAENGVSLVLSGHTHSGQFFPFTTIVKAMYGKYTHGVAYTDETASVTSSGVGTAISPVRIGTNSEIVILEIK